MVKKVLKIAPKILIIGFLLSILLQQSTIVLALTKDQRRIIDSGSLYFNLDQTLCSPAGTLADDTTTTVSGGPIYASGLRPPYILEQFAIHTLKAIAQKKGIPETDTVTQEHVIALVAFMLGEGGDINNPQLFNPLNTGLNAPELIDGTHRGDGVQSFKSFDAGVEATARTMLGSNQSRLANTLSRPESTAREFMEALTFYSRFAGNKFWAAASLPPNQSSYFNSRLALIRIVRVDYRDIASIVLGTPVKEQPAGIRDPSKLVFSSAGASADDDAGLVGSDETTGSACAAPGDAGGSTGIVNAAGYAFPIAARSKSDYNTFGALSAVPCGNSTGCHHPFSPRGSYAIDLGVDGFGPDRSQNAPVYAISAGTIVSVTYTRNSAPCNQLEFKSSVDGYVYWYGHLAPDASIKPGQRYQAGEQIGKVGPTICADNTAPHLHIDRGYPKGALGGSECCRDQGIIPLINELFNRLPG